jgi:hypothetical protein
MNDNMLIIGRHNYRISAVALVLLSLEFLYPHVAIIDSKQLEIMNLGRPFQVEGSILISGSKVRLFSSRKCFG